MDREAVRFLAACRWTGVDLGIVRLLYASRLSGYDDLILIQGRHSQVSSRLRRYRDC